MTGTPAFFLGLTDPNGKIKTLRVVKGAQAYPGFKDAIDSLLADQTSEGRPSHVGVYCSPPLLLFAATSLSPPVRQTPI